MMAIELWNENCLYHHIIYETTITELEHNIILSTHATNMNTDQAIRYWSDQILNYLIEYRKTHPAFHFLPRSNKDRHGRLFSGQWFQGGNYINVSLVPRPGGNHSTKQIGFEVVLQNPENPECRLILVHKGESQPQILDFYSDLKDRLKNDGLKEWGKDLWGLVYSGDIMDALKTCLERHVPIIQDLIKKHDVGKWLSITSPSMQNKIDRILKIRETLSDNERRIARLCWNENGWILPSGKYGKSADPKSHENDKGYGHEEWLLDLDKLIDGYHYAFLEPVWKDNQAYVGRHFNIDLFSSNAVTKQKYWVGNLNNVEVIDQNAYEKVLQEYDKRGWLNEMREQLQWLGLSVENLPTAGLNLFNIRFKPDDFQSDDLIPFEADDTQLIATYRYKLLKYKDLPESEQPETEKKPFRSSAPPPSGNGPSSRQLEAKSIELPDTHRKIVKGLYNTLLPIHGKGNIACEYSADMGNARVDIAVLHEGEEIYYEVKSYLSIRHCIRVALGQIFEYCYFPSTHRAKKMVIVAQHQPDDETEEYMQHLRDKLQVNLFYAWFDLENGILGEEI